MTPTESRKLLFRAIVEHQPSHVFALFSGGHDSLAATHLAMEQGLAHTVAHINTGIGIPETREFVRETCRSNGWPLTELKPLPKESYERLVLRFGFPGPHGHGVMYRRLKERKLRRLIRANRMLFPGRLPGFVTGLRRQESARRMKHNEPVQIKDGAIWIGPLYEWSKLDVNAYLADKNLPRNPVVDSLHMSGECLCGAFAKPGEILELETWYPKIAAEIHDLEARVKDAGHRDACLWGHRPLGKVFRDQLDLEDMGFSLCQSCEKREVSVLT